MKDRLGRSLIALIAVAGAAASVFAAGFSFYEQGAKASGQAGAWIARADDDAANWYNPAAVLRPSIPDADWTGYTVGYGYDAKRWGIDVYAMDLQFDDATATGDFLADGLIKGTYSSSILLVGVTGKYRF